MKKTMFLLLLLLSSVCLFAQKADEEEKVTPTFNVYLERVVDMASIEGELYSAEDGMTVCIKASDASRSWVRVIVKDNYTKKKIYNRKFRNSYLYAFPSGTIQVGNGYALLQLALFKTPEEKWIMEIKETGIY